MTNEEAIKILSHTTNLGYGIVIEAMEGYTTMDVKIALGMAIKALEVKPQGRWITDVDHCYSDDEDTFECSVCKEPFTLICGTPGDNLYNYCPNCGDSMIQGEKNKNE